jgi:hypothetical protein
VLAVRSTEPLRPAAGPPCGRLTWPARHPAPPGLIELSCNEIAHLFATLVIQPAADQRHRLCWSWWRRRHQARARRAHHKRQAARQQ